MLEIHYFFNLLFFLGKMVSRSDLKNLALKLRFHNFAFFLHIINEH